MEIKTLIEKTRQIMKDRYEGGKALQMSPTPEATKKDLYEQLKAQLPSLQEVDMDAMYEELSKSKDIKLVTNDIVTFSKSFVSEE